MKKGLLSLLALALTVVGCQNYDDQFAELTSAISDLQADVDGLAGVAASITSLQSTVAAITTAVGANATAINSGNTAISASLATVSSTLAALQASLGDVAQAGDLAAISSTLADVQADVRELLEANAVINQDITITNAATLEYVETLISTGDDDPNVIVNGSVEIDTANFPGITAAQLASVNAIAAKLATILGDGAAAPGLYVESDSALTFTNLAFIDDDYVIVGSDQDDEALRTISGVLDTDYAGPQNYSQLSSVGDVVISNSVSATLVDFSGVTVGTIDDDTASVGVLIFPSATSIDMGTADFTSLTANAALTVNTDADAFTAATLISATSATAIDLNSVVSADNPLTITGNATTVIHADALTSSDDITTTSAESHFGALTYADGVLTIAATDAANFASLTGIEAASSIGGETVVLTVLAAVTGTLTLPDATAVNAPAFVGSAGNGITAGDALTVSVASIAAADLVAAKMTALTTTAQAEDFTIAAATDFPALTTLNVTGKDVTGVTTTAVAVTAATTLTTVNAGGELSSLTVAGAGPETVVTSGNITDLSLTGSSIDALTLGHTFISGDTAVTIVITGTDLVSIDMSNVTKVKTITVTGNSSLTTVVGPSATTLPEAGAAISATFSGNDLSAAYTDGVSPTAATETTPAIAAVEPVITSASAASILAWWNAAAANADSGVATAVSIDIESVEFDASSAGADGNINAAFAADDYASESTPAYTGTIDAAHEIAACTAS